MSSLFERFIAKPFRIIKTLITEAPKMARDFDAWIKNLRSRLDAIQQDTADTDKKLLYGSIGMALSAWARMEEALVQIVAILLRIHVSKAGLIMYSMINFNVWLTLTHDLFGLDEKLVVHRKRWNKISERIREIKDKRDQLAHHPVHESKSEFSALQAPQYDTRQKTKRQLPLDSGEITALTGKILSITGDLLEFRVELVRTLVASDEKSELPNPDHSTQSDSQSHR